VLRLFMALTLAIPRIAISAEVSVIGDDIHNSPSILIAGEIVPGDLMKVEKAARNVIPFANVSSNAEVGYFAEGLSEDILDNLVKTGLRVTSRSASFQFDERGQDLSLVGEKLSVSYLLEGSVRQQADNLRITAQLIRVEDGFHVWSKSYDRTLADGFEMQTAIATNVANITQSKLREPLI